LVDKLAPWLRGSCRIPSGICWRQASLQNTTGDTAPKSCVHFLHFYLTRIFWDLRTWTLDLYIDVFWYGAIQRGRSPFVRIALPSSVAARFNIHRHAILEMTSHHHQDFLPQVYIRNRLIYPAIAEGS
jgi:hypothetical protein